MVDGSAQALRENPWLYQSPGLSEKKQKKKTGTLLS